LELTILLSLASRVVGIIDVYHYAWLANVDLKKAIVVILIST
jgi:hypothetical protein